MNHPSRHQNDLLIVDLVQLNFRDAPRSISAWEKVEFPSLSITLLRAYYWLALRWLNATHEAYTYHWVFACSDHQRPLALSLQQEIQEVLELGLKSVRRGTIAKRSYQHASPHLNAQCIS